MEILRLIAVHFGVAATMGLGFVVAPLARRAFIAAADLVFRHRRRRSERWLLEVRTLEEVLVEHPTWRNFDPLQRGSRSAPTR